MKTGVKAEASSLTDVSKIDNELLNKNVNIQRVKKYFSSNACKYLKILISTEKGPM